ncbi:MAG: class I SAM-dependent methyltransferase [Planctomycetes bacterium]|nr:class I SAM-dependent methyltransferase [Planctomycetota bacterium]
MSAEPQPVSSAPAGSPPVTDAGAPPPADPRYGEEYFHGRGTERSMQAPFDRMHFDRFCAKLAAAVPIDPRWSVLDLGCAVGYLTYHFAERCAHATGVDHAEPALAFARKTYARPNVDFVHSNILAFQPTRRYDLILFVSLYEHLTREEQDRLFERMKGWLTPGGVLATHTITAHSWIGRRRTREKNLGTLDFSGDPTHTCAFTLAELEAHIASHGYVLRGEYRRYGSFVLRGTRLEKLFRWLRIPDRWRHELVLEVLAVHGLA